MAQQGIWMCARSGVNSKTLLQVGYDVELTNVNRGVFYGEVGKDVEIEINAPEDLEEYDIEIDPFTPLPEGIELNGNVISGVSEAPVNKFVHILFTGPNGPVAGVSFELRIYAAANDGEIGDAKGGKKGCFGSFEMTIASVALLGLTSVGLLLIDRKKKIAE